MPLQLIDKCPHDISDRDVAHQADGLCPLCLASEVDRLRKGLEEIQEIGAKITDPKNAYGIQMGNIAHATLLGAKG